MTPMRAVVVRVLARYGAYGYPMSYWEAAAWIALMQGAGMNISLTFEPRPRGLHSEALIHTLSQLEGVCFKGFRAHALERAFEVEHFALKQAQVTLGEHGQHYDFVVKMASVMAGFESPMGAWVLSSCWWLMTQAGVSWPKVCASLSSPRGPDRMVASVAHLEAAYKRLLHEGMLFS